MSEQTQATHKSKKWKKYVLPKLKAPPAGETQKIITFTNGSRMVRNIGAEAEQWSFWNASLATLKYTIDLSSGSGCNWQGGLARNTFETPPFQEVSFNMEKKAGYELKFEIILDRETIMNIDDQFDYITQTSKDNLIESFSKTKDLIASIPFDAMTTDNLINALTAKSLTNFLDPDFPPTYETLYNPIECAKYPFGNAVQFKRPQEWNPDGWVIFKDGIDPYDIRGGELKDEWFLSALQILAENPKLVERLFIKPDCNPMGFYKIRICKNGEWNVVTIDDYFPCYVNGGPIFTFGEGNELWVMLLEKAYAKLHGSYYSLTSGNVIEALSDLTGCPVKSVQFTKGDDKEDFEDIEDQVEEWWEQLTEWDEKGYLIFTTSAKLDSDENNTYKKKKIPSHAYAIIGIAEGNEVKLVRIRNTWGVIEWDGDWCQGSENWEDDEDLAETCGYDPEVDDGTIWVTLEELYNKFDGFSTCMVEEWNEMRLKGKFIRVLAAEDRERDSVISKFYYKMNVPEDTKAVITIHQEDERILGASKRSNLDINFIVMKINEDDEMELVDWIDYVVD